MCPVNEVMESGGDYSCLQTCEHARPETCLLILIVQCYCINDLIHNSLGVCVPEENCQPQQSTGY